MIKKNRSALHTFSNSHAVNSEAWSWKQLSICPRCHIRKAKFPHEWYILTWTSFKNIKSVNKSLTAVRVSAPLSNMKATPLFVTSLGRKVFNSEHFTYLLFTRNKWRLQTRLKAVSSQYLQLKCSNPGNKMAYQAAKSYCQVQIR